MGLCLLILAFYGGGRLYFLVTDGFCIGNITSTLPNDPRWNTRPLAEEEQIFVNAILSQNFFYLGKGCQSYVFLSNDKKHVIKFFKHQHFRPKFYVRWFAFIPAVKEILADKVKEKRNKRDYFFRSWKTAFDHLQSETGLVYVHLNKTKCLQSVVTIYDKMGRKHQLNMDEMEFLIQRKVTMLCPALDTLITEGGVGVDKAKRLLAQLVKMVISEYRRGFADNDDALMQNTGIVDEQLVHVDVGAFVKNEVMRDPIIYHQELFNKMFAFRLWLSEKYPDLKKHLDQELFNEIGEKFFSMKHEVVEISERILEILENLDNESTNPS